MHSQVLFGAWHPCAAAIQPSPSSTHAAHPAHHFVLLKSSVARLSNVYCTGVGSSAQPLAQEFDSQLQQLSDWKSAFGTCYVPPSAADAPDLYKWVRWARKAAKQGLLQEEQKQQLVSLDFVWKPNVIDATWHHNYHSLRCLLDAGSITLQQLTQLQQQQQQEADADLQENMLLQQQHQQQSGVQNQQQEADADLQEAMLQQQQQQLQQQPGVQDQHIQQQQVAAPYGNTQQQQQQQQGSTPDHLQQQQQQQQQGGNELNQHHQQQQQQFGPGAYELSVWLQRQVELYGKLKLTPVKVKLLRQLGVKLHRQPGLTRANLHPVLQGKDPQTYKRRPIVVQPATPQGRRAVGRLLQQWQNWQQQQQGSVAGQEGLFAVSDPECVFMGMLGELQKWKKKFGSCVVPAGVFDKAGLAEWVQQIQLAKQAAAAAAAAAAGGDGDGVQGTHKITSSSSSNNGSSTKFVEAVINEEAVPTGADDSKQQQQQGLAPEAAAAVPVELKSWHVQELDSTGFCWHTSQDDVIWHKTFHKLRAFKHKYHHLDMHKISADIAAVTATDTEFCNSSSNKSYSSTGFSSEELLGMSEWLQQQRELLGLSAWGVTPQPLRSKDTPMQQQKLLSKVQQRMLKDLGVQPLPPVVVGGKILKVK